MPKSQTRQTRHAFTRALISACALAMLPAAPAPAFAQVNLPALGDAVSGEFTIGAERRLGEQVMRDIRRDPDYLDDPLLLEYLQSLWQPLLAAARRRGDIDAQTDARFAWEAFLVRDRTVNAFALPGGYVGVHLGLIAITGSRDELASVLGHEMSHITQRHIARSMANQGRQSLLATAALILGVIAASRSAPDAANAAIVGGQAVAIQGMLNFSRDMEREADRIGFAVMTSAGFAPGGMAAMFEKMDLASRLNDSNGYPYLRTHPLTTDRIGEARSRMGAAAQAPPAASRLEHEVMRARARVLMDTRDESLRRLQGLDAKATQGTVPERLVALVSSAQASVALRDYTRAEAAIDAALALVRGSPLSDARAERAVQLLRAQTLLARGDAAGATLNLSAYATDTSRPLLLLRTQVALSAAGAAPARPAGPAAAVANDSQPLHRAAEELQTWVSAHPLDATAWGTLSQAWTRLGQPLRAVRAEAESRAAIGDLSGAVDRLRAGQSLARSTNAAEFIEASVIDARLRELEVQRRQLAAELRGEKASNGESTPPYR